MQELLEMSSKELDRVTVLQNLLERNITQAKAAKVLNVSERHIRRLLSSYKSSGHISLISQRRGKASNRKLSKSLKEQALFYIRRDFYDYGPTLAAEKLAEYYNISISKETCRKWMIELGIWQPHLKPEPGIHPLREKRPCFGELIQIDGSDHAWFEGRNDSCTLLVFIDDATSTITELLFVEAESTLGYFNALKNHLAKYGAPKSFYSDRHGVFKVNHPAAKTGSGVTQFGRAIKQLGIKQIFATSPQAKGRVERANKTLQDRLVKELRFHGISDIESANKFAEEFRLKYNAKFATRAKMATDLHRPLTRLERDNLDYTLSIQTPRVISKDMLVRYNNYLFKIIEPGQVNRLSQTKATVCENASGKITIFSKNQQLNYQVYKKGLHVDQIFNRKEFNQKFNKLLNLEKAWKPWSVRL